MAKFKMRFSNSIDSAKPVKGAYQKKPTYGKNFEILDGVFDMELKNKAPMEHEKYMPKYEN